jgi:hypothetical protein
MMSSAAADRMGAVRTAWAGVVVGALFLLSMQILAERLTSGPFIGGYIYNYYFLSLMHGTLDIPAQIAGLEGFYDSDGRAFLYHGLGPLVTRALAYPFLDLTVVDLRPFTIWLFATIGSACFYLTAVSVVASTTQEQSPDGRSVSLVLWLMVWILAPGFVLASNGSFFHEPVAVAFAMSGIAVLCLWRLVQTEFTGWVWLIALACAAAFAVHSRPHIAVGLYAAAVIASGVILWRLRSRALLPVAVAMLILLLSGLLYLQMNALKFGSIAQTSGTVTDAGAVYGFRYWGWEPPDHPRFRSNETHGQFNAGRILPNLFLYGFSMGGEGSVSLYRRLTADLGHIRIEPPVIGFALLWLPWCIHAFAGFRGRSGANRFLWLGLAASIPGALLMLAYTTVTMRYRIEIWPVFFVPAVIGLATVLARARNDPEALRRVLFSLWVSVVAAGAVGALNSIIYVDILNWDWGSALRSYEDCARMVTDHPDLGAGKVGTICVLDQPAS